MSEPSGGRWTALRSVRVTRPGGSPRLLLRPLVSGGAEEGERHERWRWAAPVGDTVPRLLMEFADRLEAVFERGARLPLLRARVRESRHRLPAAESADPVAAHQSTPALPATATGLDQPTPTGTRDVPAPRRLVQESEGEARLKTPVIGAPHATPQASSGAGEKRRRVDPAEASVTAHQFAEGTPSERRQKTQGTRYDGDTDSETSATQSCSQTFSVFTTPRRDDRRSPGLRRPTRPRAQLKRPSVADRWHRGSATPARTPDGSSRQRDFGQTPHRHSARLKPERVANRWQHMSSAPTDGRPRPDLGVDPSRVTPQRDRRDSQPQSQTPSRSSAQPHADHPALQQVATSPDDRGRVAASPATPRGQTDVFKFPAPRRAAVDADATFLPPAPLDGWWQLRSSPGGCGDRLLRVQRWLNSSPSVTGRQRQSTPSQTSVASSVASGRRRRPRIEYAEEEVQNLLKGVQKYGRDFKAIRLAYDFHPSRTTVDLYDKWRHMGSQNAHGDTQDAPSAAGDAAPRAESVC